MTLSNGDGAPTEVFQRVSHDGAVKEISGFHLGISNSTNFGHDRRTENAINQKNKTTIGDDET